jgi:hypothetical protein
MIGRDKERALLEKCYSSKKSEFVAIYGRRRIGKTFLVKETFAQRLTFYATGILDAEMTEQLRSFNTNIAHYGGLELKPATTWAEAFENLNHLIDSSSASGKKVVFIDEIPWMSTVNSGFLAALDYFWNRWISSRNDVLLIICGSAASWMIDNITNNTGGLHNRLTHQIELAPFTLKECEAYYRENHIAMTKYQMAEAYMIFGGIPYYLSLMDSRFSMPQNVDALYFAKDAELRNEYQNLYYSLFKNAENHIKVIEALAKKAKGLNRAEILAATGMTNGGYFSKIISELISSGFIRAYNAFGRNQRDKLYQLVDPFTLFHLKFVGKASAYNENYWSQFSIAPAHNTWSGYAFELVCLLHIPQIKNALGISGILTEVSSWRSKVQNPGAQVDLVIDRSDNVINLCEIKYSQEEFLIGKSYDANLRNKRAAFIAETTTKKSAQTTMITTYGLKRNEYGNAISQKVVLDDLFKI